MSERYRSQLPSFQSRRQAERTSLRPTPAPTLDKERAAVLQGAVRRLLEQQSPAAVEDERRRTFRRPYPGAMLMTDCDEQRRPILESTATVVAKDLSSAGIGFVHNRTPQHAFVTLTFQVDQAPALCMLALVRRVQPIRQGLYLIGVEFVGRLNAGGNDERPAGPGSPAPEE